MISHKILGAKNAIYRLESKNPCWNSMRVGYEGLLGMTPFVANAYAQSLLRAVMCLDGLWPHTRSLHLGAGLGVALKKFFKVLLSF